MKGFLTVLVCFAVVPHVCLAQLGGGSVYNQYSQNRGGGAEANERAKRQVTKDEMPPSSTSMFLDASVLINVKADEYVAVFGVQQEAATLEEARRKMDGVVAQFSADLKQLGVAAGDLYVDFVAQNRVYGYEISGDVAKEIVTGFEVKKNVSIHFRAEPLLEKYLAAASRAGIFDLIKVDYVVKDVDAVHTKLMEQATRVIKRKADNHARLLGIHLRQPPQVYAERYSSYFPTEMYTSYVAQESEDVSAAYNRQRFTIQGARKARTFYFDALSAKLFDHVVNPVVTEPMIQFTLYLKVKYDTGQVLAKPVKAVTGKVARK